MLQLPNPQLNYLANGEEVMFEDASGAAPFAFGF